MLARTVSLLSRPAVASQSVPQRQGHVLETVDVHKNFQKESLVYRSTRTSDVGSEDVLDRANLHSILKTFCLSCSCSADLESGPRVPRTRGHVSAGGRPERFGRRR